MKAEIRVEKTVVLQLNEEEVEWLKTLVQNLQVDPDDID